MRIPKLRLGAATLLSGAILATSGVASNSLAQGKTPPTAPESRTQTETTPPAAPSVAPMPDRAPGSASDWRASRLIGTTMTNTLGENVGNVSDVVIDGDGKVVAVLVSVGGFLGLGETSVAIGLRHLVITHADQDRLDVKTSLSRTAIEQAAALEAHPDQPAVQP